LFSLPSIASTASGPSILFDDIDNTPMVRHRKSDAHLSSFIFVDANAEEDAVPFPKLTVPAGPGGCIEVKFILFIEVDCALGSEVGENVEARSKVQIALFIFVSLRDVRNAAKSFSGTRHYPKSFSNCRTRKPGDTVVQYNPI
jgi:hypothetical protein